MKTLQQKIEQWLITNKIFNYTLEKSSQYHYIIHVDGNVNLNMKDLSYIPYKFGIVTGQFSCAFNKLTSLHNAPYEAKDFFCQWNTSLISLEGGPEKVHNTYNCSFCSLHTLKGAPSHVTNFLCHNNPFLQNLEYGPIIVENLYNTEFCNLTTLKGAPTKVYIFNCSYNENLTSLEFAPQNTHIFICIGTSIIKLHKNLKIQQCLNVSGSNQLLDLTECPESVNEYDFSHCGLKSLNGLPTTEIDKLNLSHTIKRIDKDDIIQNLSKSKIKHLLCTNEEKQYLEKILPTHILQKININIR